MVSDLKELELKRWLVEDNERVILELTTMLTHLDVEIGDICSLREATDRLLKQPIIHASADATLINKIGF